MLLTMNKLVAALFIAIAAAVVSAQQQNPLRNYIKHSEPVIALTNVRVIDGTGAPAFTGDVAVRDGRMIAGNGVTSSSTRSRT